MNFKPIAEISVGERQRKDFGPQALQELKDSITQVGLLHAPVLTASGQLVVGERRLRAMTALHQEGIPFTYGGTPVPVDSIPFVAVGDISDEVAAEAEFAENIFRVDLTWQERTEALKRLLELRREAAPASTTLDVARELVAANPEKKLSTTRQELARASIIADHLDDPMVKRARSAEEAYKIILDKAESKVKAQSRAIATPTLTQHRLIHGDCLVEMKKLPPGIADTIICDPPYGMKADKMGKGEYHMYDDSPEAALNVCKGIISEGFRLTKPKAILFLFCDLDHFITLRTYASQQAWTCWRSPILWRKGNDGHSPWGRAGFIRTYEALLFAVKGQKELVYPGGPDILDYKRPGRGERVHSAEKPVDLLRTLIRLSTLPGQTVFDPTAGSGPILEAATLEKVKAIAIEKEEAYYHECVNRLSKPIAEPAVSEVEAEILSD